MIDGASAGTIVVCRREHLREAAVVLSCVPSNTPVPLIVLEPPPCTHDEYRALYAAYREVADVRDLASGTDLARVAPMGPAPQTGDVDAAAERLTPYRQWVKHQAFVARLLHDLAPSRAVFLFAPDPEDTCYIEPLPMHALDGKQFSIVPEEAEWIVFSTQASSPGRFATHAYSSLSELADVAWSMLRGDANAPGAAEEIPETRSAAFLTGLYRALQRGVVLRPVTKPTEEAATCDPSGGVPLEAVLIECSNDAERLLGVLYARSREARLVIVPEPDAAAIERARAAIERANAPKPLPPGLTTDEIIAAVRASLFADDDTTAVRALETAVSTAFPEAAFEAVGTLPVTALTTSTPYNFVAKNGTSWAEKAIGHIAGDVSSLLLTEMFATPWNDVVGFNLLFDPGYMKTPETGDVLGGLALGPSYTVDFAGAAAASIALAFFAPALPIDLIFFNTHGSGNGIKFADLPQPLPAFKLVQRTKLSSRPIVFNNSCLSWVGVGREFVRSGARGYIGTLWSVHEAEAAEYAKAVIDRMVRAEEPVSVAMRNSGVAAGDARAYTFVGTASARLHWGAKGNATTPQASTQRLLRAASHLLAATDRFLSETAGALANPYVLAMTDVLIGSIEAALAEVDREIPVPSGERIEAALAQMRVYAALVARDERRQVQSQRFFARWIALLPAIPGNSERFEARSLLFLFASRVPARLGTWQQTQGALSRSIEAANAAGVDTIRQHLELCDAFVTGGRYDDARRTIEIAAAAYKAASREPDVDLLARQTAVLLGYRKFDEAVASATHAHAAAVRSDDLRGQASSKIDEAAAYLAKGDAPRALEAARAAVAGARLAYDSEIELRANEVLASAYLGTGRVDDARALAARSLELAKAWRWTFGIAAQLEIVGDVAAAERDGERAIASWCDAARAYVNVCRPVCEARVRDKVDRAATSLGTPGTVVQFLVLSLGVIDDFDPTRRGIVAHRYVEVLGDLVTRFEARAIAHDLGRLSAQANAMAAARGPDASEDFLFMVSMTSMLVGSEGRAPDSLGV